MTQQKLSAERARELFSYDPETGAITWRVNKHRAKSGDEAGCNAASGQLKLQVDQKKYLGHRVVWLIVTGKWPRQSVDHINGDPSDNRWANLRDISHRENIENQVRPHKRSSTGYLGVSRKGHGFQAQIMVQGAQKRLGTYATPQEAHQAYVTAKRQVHVGCTI